MRGCSRGSCAARSGVGQGRAPGHDVVRAGVEGWTPGEEQDRVGQWLRNAAKVGLPAPGSRVGRVGADDTSHFTFSSR